MKILLACDASDHSAVAIDETINSPWPGGAEFRVISIADTSFSPAATVQRLMESAQAVVDQAVERLQSGLPGDASVSGEALSGYPKAEIIRCAEVWSADLIVVGSRGLRGIKKVLMGAVSHSVVLSASCSVRIARRVKPEKSGHRVVLAVDGSSFSDQAVNRIASRPWPDGTQFLICTAVPTLVDFMSEVQDTHEVQSLELYRSQQVAEAQENLSKVARTLKERFSNCQVSHEVLDGDPREVVVERAGLWDASLIVTGCRGKGWIDRMLIGSVSEAIATMSDCSVEVVKH